MLADGNDQVPIYSTRRPSRCERLSIRGVGYNLRRWGRADARPILFLHGGRDSSITFQFVVDALTQDWSVIAPDFRGHGGSEWSTQGYWLHEVLADLDALFLQVLSDRPTAVVGHSMGGNLASIYAGLRPDRVSKLVSLDAFGPPLHQVPADMSAVLGRYLDRIRQPREPIAYPSIAAMAQRLRHANRRLELDKAMFLAEHSSSRQADGSYRWRFDPSYQGSLPSLHHMDEWRAIWSRIRAPVLWIAAGDHRANAPGSDPEVLAARREMMPSLAFERIPDTGHNLHHDAPATVGQLIERFLC
ncbi:MAG: alpha/beta hydrolase [Proteobacteria bacterium]|nr:alpha/beta hydrolase [Pseudomonadota bacterium]MBI3496096.1 alpha/beta hydrolase [Pseudomonadota bacterium]